MREIKFRAWDKLDKKIRDIKSIQLLSGEVELYYKDNHGISYYPKRTKNDIILLEFIGLKDKNGEYIYEGNIVRGSFTDQDNENYDFIDVVDFKDGKFQCENNADFDLWVYILEIIGNKFENPELLKT